MAANTKSAEVDDLMKRLNDLDATDPPGRASFDETQPLIMVILKEPLELEAETNV